MCRKIGHENYENCQELPSEVESKQEHCQPLPGPGGTSRTWALIRSKQHSKQHSKQLILSDIFFGGVLNIFGSSNLVFFQFE